MILKAYTYKNPTSNTCIGAFKYGIFWNDKKLY